MRNILYYNVFSNILARIWSVAIGFLVLPLFPAILGFEAYGLIGFYLTLTASFQILDFGLSITLSRELAKIQISKVSHESIRNLVFTVEMLYWGIAVIIGLIITLLSSYIGQDWLKINTLTANEVIKCIILIGIIIAFEWPQSLYGGGIMGLQKHTTYNKVNILYYTVKNLGALLVLKFISPTIITFFLWQIILSILYTFTLRHFLWKFLPKSDIKPIFSQIELKKIRKFAFGMTGIGLSTLILNQIDKILISKQLPLEQLGYYSFGFSVGTSVGMITGVLSNVIFPKLVSVIEEGNSPKVISHYYHKFLRAIAFVSTPIAFLLFFFSQEIVFIWTNNRVTALNTHLIISIFSLGVLFNSYVSMSYNLMLAYGWTKFTIYQNIILCIIAVPLVLISLSMFGAVGGTSICFVGNLGYLIISLPLIHRRLLKGELKTVYLKDIGISFLSSILIIGAAKYFFNSNFNKYYQITYFLFTLIVSYFTIIVFTKDYYLSGIGFIKKSYNYLLVKQVVKF